jgi:secreted PhoX family phosphatase
VSDLPRRALLALGAAGLALPAQAQITTLDLRPAVLPLRPDDWVAPGHRREMLIRWGDRVTFDAPAWEPRNPTPEAAAAQFGWDARMAGVVAPPLAADGVKRLVLGIAHPEVEGAMAAPPGRDRPALAAALAGLSVLNLEQQGGRWVLVDGGFQSRRIGIETLCRVTGPGVAGIASASGGGGASVQGLIGPTGGCATPWGTLLLPEPSPGPWLDRLAPLDQRFREPARFGWVVEVDPLDPQSVPAKRTALGRIGAQAVAAGVTANGRAVVFLADGRARGRLYRFLSAGPAAEPGALDAGTLSVARIEDNAILWRDLPAGSVLDPEGAALGLGASAFDNIAGLALDPRRPRLLLASRGGQRGPRELDFFHARPGSSPGFVLDFAGDLAAPRLAGEVLLLAGDAVEGGRQGAGQPISGTVPRHPATLSVDARGRLWLGTDRRGQTGPAPDTLFACDLDGPGRGLMLPVYGAPRGAGIGGVALSPELDAALVVVRTPGAEPGASFDRPATRWPAFEPRTPPRSAVVVLGRTAGPPVGG